MKTADLIGPALDWAVAQVEFVEVEYINDGITRCLLRVSPFTGMYRPSTDWSQGGPIIEREGIKVGVIDDDTPVIWAAQLSDPWRKRKSVHSVTGPTLLIAAMRCFVAATLGDEVDVPDELV